MQVELSHLDRGYLYKFTKYSDKEKASFKLETFVFHQA